MAGQRWTENEDKSVIQYIEKGFKHKDIAIKLNRTKRSIDGRCRILNARNNINSLKTHEQYEKELAESNSNMIVMEQYINDSTPILHKCLNCKIIYKCTPNDKLAGKKCKFCSPSFNPLVPAILYLVYFYNIKLFKIGITSRTTVQRNNDQDQKYEIILELHFDTGREAMIKEQEWLETTKHLQVNTGLLKSGNTETFRY